MRERLPYSNPAREGEERSEASLLSILSSVFTVRKEGRPDYGVDGSLEVKLLSGGNFIQTNYRAPYQLKHVASPEHTPPGPLPYRLETKNINYLCRDPRSLYFIFDAENDAMYFEWVAVVRMHLQQNNPSWQEQETATYHFNKVLDQGEVEKLAYAIKVRGQGIAESVDGPGFCWTYAPGSSLPPLFPAMADHFVGRAAELDQLEGCITWGTVVAINGPPASGKTALAAKYLIEGPSSTLFDKCSSERLSILHLAPDRMLPPRVVRSLAASLGISRLRSLTHDEVSVQLDERQQQRQIMGEFLATKTQESNLMVVVDDCVSTLGEERERAALERLMATPVSQRSSYLVIGFEGSLPTGRGKLKTSRTVWVDALSVGEAQEFLRHKLDQALVNSISGALAELPAIRYPGVLRRGLNILNPRLSEEGEITAEDLVDALIDATEMVVHEILDVLGVGSLDGVSNPDSLEQLLLAWAVLGGKPIAEDVVHCYDFAEELLERLHSSGAIERTGADVRLDSVLTGGFRQYFKNHILGDEQQMAVVADALETLLLGMFAEAPEEQWEELAYILEGACAWLSHQGGHSHLLLKVLLPRLGLLSIDQRFMPDLAALEVDLNMNDLETKASLLASAARTGEDSRDFIRAFGAAVDAVVTGPKLSAPVLWSLDTAGLVGAKRFFGDKSLLSVRQKLLRSLSKWRWQVESNPAICKWMVSWCLNTATLALNLGKRLIAGDVKSTGETLFGYLPMPSERWSILDWYWLRIRSLLLEARLERWGEERRVTLSKAFETASELVRVSRGGDRQVRLFLRVARKFIQEVEIDDDRIRTTDTVEATLSEVGVLPGGPIALRCMYSAYLRFEAASHGDLELRLARALRAVTEFPEEWQLESVESPQALAVLIRNLVFVAECHEELGDPTEARTFWRRAKSVAEMSTERVATAELWILLLEVTEKTNRHNGLDRESGTFQISDSSKISESLGRVIESSEAWLSQVTESSVEEGRLALWCVVRRWKEAGNVVKAAASRAADRGWEWERTPKKEKKRLVSIHHSKRKSLLDGLELRYGAFPDLYIKRLWSESQYRRWLAIQADHQVEREPVLAILDTAKALWPDSLRVAWVEAEFHRYIWNLPEATACFRTLMDRASDGWSKRSVSTQLIETLLVAAVHGEQVLLPGGSVFGRDELLAEAWGLVQEQRAYQRASRRGAGLAELVELEQGGQIDWDQVDEAYDKVVGGVGQFVTTVLRNLDELGGNTKVPITLADHVQTNFTDREILGRFGRLILRAVELKAYPNIPKGCLRAYAVFDACRVLEEATEGSENLVTEWSRARSVLLASKETGRPSPLPGLDIGQYRSQLQMAVSLLQRVNSKNVGGFHTRTLEEVSEASRFLAELER